MKSITLVLSILFYFIALNDGYSQITTTKETIKTNAFEVLVMKCNVCHATKKKQDIFTLKNIDSLATEINKQVFIKKKMPKGRKIKLTKEELLALRKWLDLSLN